MFLRANNTTPKSKMADTTTTASGPSDRSVPSIVSADLVVTGDLSCGGEIQIDGRVEGDIECAALIVGISGSVTGEVRVERLRLHGSISGQVTAKSVFLASTARIMGDINHECLAVEPGAYMEGHCRRMVPAPEPVTQTPKLALSHKVGSASKSDETVDEGQKLDAIAS